MCVQINCILPSLDNNQFWDLKFFNLKKLIAGNERINL